MDNTNSKSEYKILEKINSPKDLKSLTISELSTLSEELRSYIIETVKKTGGHLAPSLGVVELTVALHYVFNTPEDKLVWDVGHQAYAHKVLTGRREALKTIRQYGGISGFCKPSESEYDVFGAGHASTSISAAVGLAVARDLRGNNNRIAAVIGDGAFTGGLVWEGINNVYKIKGQFLIILNDNEMSISHNVGAMSNYLTRIVTSPRYLRFKNQVWNSLAMLPKGTSFLRSLGRKSLESLKNFIAPGLVFEEFGFRYYGPIDGHDIELLIETFQSVKDLEYPVLLHIITKKGKGLLAAEQNPTKYHGIGPEKYKDSLETQQPTAPAFLKAFGKIACEIAENNPKAVFITAAMSEGTGLVEFSKRFPGRYFDVGIAEGHAVIFSGGLATGGYRPVVAIYSTFLQRAYDQVIHDIALQSLPVVFAMDRAGIVGADGPTHHGAFDISYINIIPNMIIAAPRNGNELRDILYTALDQSEKPFAIRYPKASYEEFDENLKPKILKIGSWEMIEKGKNVAILSVGTMTNVAKKSVELLKSDGISPTVVHARFIKPFDEKLLLKIARSHSFILTIEENSIKGGFGMNINKFISDSGINCRVISLGIPDNFIEQGGRDLLLRNIGLYPEGVAEVIKNNL